MATKVWTNSAGSDGNFATAGNWFTPTGAAAGAAPVDGDDVIFKDGSVSVTAGLTPGAGGDELHSLVVYPTYYGKIGASNSRLTCRIDNGTNPYVHFMGGGSGGNNSELWIETTTAAGIARIIAEAAASNSSPTACNVTTSGAGTVTDLLVKSGSCEIIAGSSVATTTVDGGDLTVDPAVTLTSAMIQNGGRVNNKSTGTLAGATLHLNGGQYTQTSGHATAGWDVVWQRGSTSRFIWIHGGNNWAIGIYHLVDGILDVTRLKVPATITTLRHYATGPSCLADLRCGRKLAITNFIAMSSNDLALRFDAGRQFALA